MRVEKKADNMKYAIVGAGGHALEMTEVLLSLGTHQKEIDYFVEESFFDSASKLNTQSLDELVKKPTITRSLSQSGTPPQENRFL